MDESWRLPLGWLVPTQIPPEQSTTDPCGSLQVNDFQDVFGGPPPTLLRRQLSCSGDLTTFNSPLSFYAEVFKPPPLTFPSNAGRQLPNFTIPSPPSKLSAVDNDGDDGFSSFMSKLRPIAVRRQPAEGEEYTAACPRHCFTRRRTAGCAPAARIIESCIRLFRHDHSSPEAAADWRSCLAEEETSCGSNSPFSEMSSIYDDVPMATIRSPRPEEAAAAAALAGVAEEAEVSIVSATGGEAAEEEWWAALDDAVAWAKEQSRL